MTAIPKPPRDNPPRYRALRRFALAALALCAWNVGLWFVWNFEADRRLAAFVAERRALGEPVLAEDFNRPMPADELNAAPLLVEVGGAMMNANAGANREWMSRFADAYFGDGYFAFPECDIDGRPELGPVRPSIERTRTALARPHTDYGTRFRSGQTILPMGHLSALRYATKIMCSASEAERLNGDWGEAWRLAAETIEVARRSSSAPHSIIGILVASVCTGVACERIVALCETRVDAAAPGRAWAEQALRRLVDDADIRNLTRDSWHGERFIELDGAISGPPLKNYRFEQLSGWNRPHTWLAKVSHVASPPLQLHVLRVIRRMSAFSDRASRGRYDRGSGARDDGPFVVHRWPFTPLYLGQVFAGRGDRTFEVVGLNFARMRTTALVLAIRLFESDHGCMPPALSDLVPVYLPALPEDPFGPPGSTIQYCRECDPPRVFSVGPTGVFDGVPARRLGLDEIRRSFREEIIVLLPPQAPAP